MSQWYLSKDGKAQGPMGEKKIISLLKSGDLGHLDLVYQVGQSEWTPLSGVEQFQEFLKKEEPPAKKTKSSRDWVLLKKIKGKKGSEFKQLGPFSHEQVMDLIEKGEIRFKDFAWREGLESWVPIAKVDEFQVPLPSTPPVDARVYEQFVEETQVDFEQASSLSELVQIENFEHEKTDIAAINLENSATSTEDIPLGVDTFISPSPEKENYETGGESELWSLKPPETDPGANEKTAVASLSLQDTRANRKIKSAKGQSSKKVKPKKKKSVGPNRFDRFVLRAEEFWERLAAGAKNEHPWAWVVAGCALVLSVLFLFLSFSGENSEEVADHKEPPVVENVVSGLEAQDEVVADIGPDPQLNMGKTVLPEPISPVREIASKKKKKKKLKKISKKKVPKKKVSKKVFAQPAKGSKRNKSFYIQRDRKALFYSSLKAEGLINEIESKYKKLRKRKKSWKKYYSGWKRRARKIMPRVLSKFPEKNTKYAYPKLLARFKKDQKLMFSYGAVYNAKVVGARRPSSSPKNLKKLFQGYRKQAQRLAR